MFEQRRQEKLILFLFPTRVPSLINTHQQAVGICPLLKICPTSYRRNAEVEINKNGVSLTLVVFQY